MYERPIQGRASDGPKRSIARSGRVDFDGPAVDAAGEVEGGGEALRPEKGDGACAADAVMAVDHEGLGFPGSKFVEAVGDLAQGNQDGPGKGDELVFLDLTDELTLISGSQVRILSGSPLHPFWP